MAILSIPVTMLTDNHVAFLDNFGDFPNYLAHSGDYPDFPGDFSDYIADYSDYHGDFLTVVMMNVLYRIFHYTASIYRNT